MACHQQCLCSTVKQKLSEALRHVYGWCVFTQCVVWRVASLKSQFKLFSLLLLYFCIVARREFVISLFSSKQKISCTAATLQLIDSVSHSKTLVCLTSGPVTESLTAKIHQARSMAAAERIHYNQLRLLYWPWKQRAPAWAHLYFYAAVLFFSTRATQPPNR